MNGHLIKCIGKNMDVSALVARLTDEPQLFNANTWRQDYVVQLDRPVSPQQDTAAVMFRWAPVNTIESVRDSTDILIDQNMEKISEVHRPLICSLKAAGASECGRVFVARLKPGGKVIPHMDYGKYADKFERFHLVLTSDPGNMFHVTDHKGYKESCYMKPGELYWFNHKEVHWAENESATPRMHLIIDCVAPLFRRDRHVSFSA